MSSPARDERPLAGRFAVGLGYRQALHHEMFGAPAGTFDFVELHPENYVGLGGSWRRRLEQVAARWPIITHGLMMSLGSVDPIDSGFLEAIAGFTDQVGTPWHSDHLSTSGALGSQLHDLLPIPMTRDNARRVAERIREVQSSFGIPFAIENVSAYGRRVEDTLSEPDFVSEVVERADCPILLDVNNVLVNAINFGADPFEQLARFPAEAAVQIHVAGFTREAPELVIDTHGEPVDDAVWPLLEEALRRTGPVPVLLERDNNFPDFGELVSELATIRQVGDKVFGSSGEVRHAA